MDRIAECRRKKRPGQKNFGVKMITACGNKIDLLFSGERLDSITTLTSDSKGIRTPPPKAMILYNNLKNRSPGDPRALQIMSDLISAVALI
jgi:hypothetical protein